MKRILIFSFFLISQTLFFNVTKAQDPVLVDNESELIENVHSTASNNAIKVYWNIKYASLNTLDIESSSIIIRYNLKMVQDRFEKGKSVDGWTAIEGIPIDVTSYQITNLQDGEEYIFQIGLIDGKHTYWSESNLIKTKGKWGLFELFVLIGSLALFLYGMKIMSDGLQQAIGKRLRHILGSITSNPFKGILTGLGITSLVQSSSVTTVMVVSFVNAGILTLFQAAGVIMGANIGTTVTAWLIDIFGFKVDISAYTLILLAIGIPLSFLSSSKIKSWANVIIGFSLLFLGLGFLKAAVPEVSPESSIVSFFVTIQNVKYFSTIIAVLFGAVLTVIIQSSSATVALTMTLMASGIIPFEVGAAMVLGENIGTTITAELAASVGNVGAKRAARIHTLFNIFGVIIALLFFPFLMQLVVFITLNYFGGDPIQSPVEYGSTGLAVLHTTFNFSNTLIMVWFIPYLVKIVTGTVKDRAVDDEFHLEYLGERSYINPELSIAELKKELAVFGKITNKMSELTGKLLVEKDQKKVNELSKQIQKYEEVTDKVEIEIANYLIKLSSHNIDEELAKRINGMNRIISNLERVGDIFSQISLLIIKKNENKISLSEIHQQRLLEMIVLLNEAFDNMNNNLSLHVEDVTLTKAQELEDRINQKRDEIRLEYYRNILPRDKTSTVEADLLYNNLYNLLERIGDHIINVSEGIIGKI